MGNSFLSGSTVKLTKKYLTKEGDGMRLYFPEGFDAGTELRVLSSPKDDKLSVKLEGAFQHPVNKNLWASDVIMWIPMEYFGKV